jgi:phospholipase C
VLQALVIRNTPSGATTSAKTCWGRSVIYPYSRGPLKVSDVFDHTSTLKFISRRFNVPVPNISAWRK